MLLPNWPPMASCYNGWTKAVASLLASDCAGCHSTTLWAALLVSYGLSHSILFHILIEKREKLALDQELSSYSYSKVM